MDRCLGRECHNQEDREQGPTSQQHQGACHVWPVRACRLNEGGDQRTCYEAHTTPGVVNAKILHARPRASQQGERRSASERHSGLETRRGPPEGEQPRHKCTGRCMALELQRAGEKRIPTHQAKTLQHEATFDRHSRGPVEGPDAQHGTDTVGAKNEPTLRHGCGKSSVREECGVKLCDALLTCCHAHSEVGEEQDIRDDTRDQDNHGRLEVRLGLRQRG
mmetsp:Transcript_60770/g.168471  ORF Transcript_60770/g.168471 Transcript_60770/m.168471 type:complete len:220 (-) Transcript_60770:221-880(-)